MRDWTAEWRPFSLPVGTCRPQPAHLFAAYISDFQWKKYTPSYFYQESCGLIPQRYIKLLLRQKAYILLTITLVHPLPGLSVCLSVYLCVCVCVCDGYISLTVSQTDLRFGMCLTHGTKLCILDFEDFCLCISKVNYLRRPWRRGGVLFPRGRLLGEAPPQISVR